MLRCAWPELSAEGRPVVSTATVVHRLKQGVGSEERQSEAGGPSPMPQILRVNYDGAGAPPAAGFLLGTRKFSSCVLSCLP